MLVLSSPQRNLSGTGINLPKIMQPVSVGADRSAACLELCQSHHFTSGMLILIPCAAMPASGQEKGKSGIF